MQTRRDIWVRFWINIWIDTDADARLFIHFASDHLHTSKLRFTLYIDIEDIELQSFGYLVITFSHSTKEDLVLGDTCKKGTFYFTDAHTVRSAAKLGKV